VDVQDGSATVAHVVIGRPCHARFGSVELSVDDQKLQSGGATWTTEIHDGNPAFLRDGVLVIRLVFPSQQEAHTEELDVLDPHGLEVIQISYSRGALDVSHAGQTLRHGRRSGTSSFQLGSAQITGTDNLLLAGLLASPEVPPEVRALEGCGELVDGR
jgi:hypothetical protein